MQIDSIPHPEKWSSQYYADVLKASARGNKRQPQDRARYGRNLTLVKVAFGVQVPPVLVNCHCKPTTWPAVDADQLVKLASVVDTVLPGDATALDRSTTCDLTGNPKQLEPPSALHPPGGV